MLQPRYVYTFTMLALGLCTSGCAANRATIPDSGPPWSDAIEACKCQQESIRAEYCDPDDPRADCPADELACEQVLDLDGDGKHDRVQFVMVDDARALGVHWGHGGTEVIGEIPVYDEGVLFETLDSVDWLMSWRVARHTGEGYGIPVLLRTVHFTVPEALGDGLTCSGSDAAGLLYYTPVGFRMLHLGF